MRWASKPALPWGIAAGVVLVGWYSGYVSWGPYPDQDSYIVYFDVFVPALTLLVGLPLSVAAGLLVGGSGWRSVLGYGLLASGGVAMAYTTSFVFFGGFCMDPGDACVTSWASRFTAPLVALGCLAAGFVVRARRLRRAV